MTEGSPKKRCNVTAKGILALSRADKKKKRYFVISNINNPTKKAAGVYMRNKQSRTPIKLHSFIKKATYTRARVPFNKVIIKHFNQWLIKEGGVDYFADWQ